MADDLGPFRTPASGPSSGRSRFESPIVWFWGIGAFVLTAIVAWAYWPALIDIGNAWTSNPDYTHGFFVIPISVWLLWLRRNQAPENGFTIDWRGLFLIALAGAIRLAAGRFFLLQLDAWSIPFWVGGVVWLLLGWPTFRWALPSIAFLWFATPLPGTIESLLSTPLQTIAASLSATVLRLIGQPALVEGTTILLDDQVLDVERACSGLRMFYGILALSVACVAVARPSRWKAVLVVLAAAPVAIIANVVRIAATALLKKYASSESAAAFSHDLAGLVMIPLAVILFLLFLILLGRVTNRLSEPGGITWLTKWCLGGIVVIAGLAVWGHYQQVRALTTLRETAARYESEQKWKEAVQYLTRYVGAKPDDDEAYTHLAKIFQAHAGSYQDRLRAVDLLRAAWKKQPKNEDLALGAIQIASQVRDFDDAIKISADVLEKTAQTSTRSAATKMRAAALYSYLRSDKNHGDYSWDSVKEAFESELKLPDYDITHAAALANIYRNQSISIKGDQREKMANALLDRVVSEHKDDPMAWLVRYQHRASSSVAAEVAKAEGDLNRALALTNEQPRNPACTAVFLAAASYKKTHGDSKQAAELLQRAIEASPANPQPYIMLAELKRSTRAKDAAEEALKTLKQGHDRTAGREWSISLPYAYSLAENGKLDEADAIIAPMERIVPQIIGREKGIMKLTVGLVRGQILYKRDGAQSAVKHLRALLDDPEIRLSGQQVPDTLARGYAFLGQLYSALGLTDLALDSFRQAARLQPTNPDWQIQSANLAQAVGDLDSADREYRTFAEKGLESGDVRAGRVQIEIQRQVQKLPQDRDWSEAKRMLQSAQEKGAPRLSVHLLAADILNSSGEREKAEKLIIKLTDDMPNEPSAWRALATIRLQGGDVAGALQAADKFSATAPQRIDAAAFKASILANSSRTDDAVKELTLALDKSAPNDASRAAIALAQLQMQLGKAAEARGTLEIAHEKDPNNLQIVDVLANNAWIAQDWKSLEKYESWLQAIEGDGGTVWKAYSAQRLLAAAQSVGDKPFQEAVAQVDDVLRARPRWSKAHYLQGEIAQRMNRPDAAVASYERAWQLGGRGVLLADRLVDVLTQQGRFADATRYVAQMRDYLTVSQGLFDRAIPYLAKGNESQEMARLARQWVQQKPNDSDAHLRLGRVLLMLANSAAVDQKQKYLDEANGEFRRAIELAPNDVRPWAASVLLYGESPTTRNQALQILDALAREAKINELERAFVLAQLYETLGIASRAQAYYAQASSLIEAKPKTPGAGRVLGRAAHFYLPRVPALAEHFARNAIAQDPTNSDAREVLLTVLANKSDAQSADEGLRLLDESKSKGSVDASAEARYRAVLLSRRGKPDDIAAAVELLRNSIGQTRDDKLMLAHLYEQSGQNGPAFETYQQLARSPAASAVELAEFLRFWQQNFVAKTRGKVPIQFASQAKEIYQRLGDLPDQLPERLRWHLRELKARNPDGQVTAEACSTAVTDVLTSAAAKKLTDKDMPPLFQRILITLAQEQHDACAARLVMNPPKGFVPQGAAILLCHAFLAVPATKDVEANRQQAIDMLLAAHGANPDVRQAIADYQFMTGKYAEAIANYERVLQLNSNQPMARNNLALALSEIPQRSNEAKQKLAEALKAKPDNPDLLDTQAAIDIAAGHPDQAVPVLGKLITENPENPVLRFHISAAYDALKNKTAARENLIAAAALGIQRQVLSPRDRKLLEDLSSRYLSPDPTVAAQDTSLSNQARD